MTNQTGARARHKTTTRRAIQTAAIELYEERGYDETKVEDIVERAGVSQRSFFRYFPYKELTLFSDDHTEHLAELVLTAPSHFNAIETLDWATAQLFLIPTTELDRRRQAIRNQLGDDARVQRQLAYLHESLSIRLRDAYVRRLGIDPADTSDLRPQILVGLYLSLATEVSGRSQSPEETRQRWLASLRSLLWEVGTAIDIYMLGCGGGD